MRRRHTLPALAVPPFNGNQVTDVSASILQINNILPILRIAHDATNSDTDEE